jgi:CheY-like chemotaxis protein
MKKVLYLEDSVTSQLLMRKYLDGLCHLVTVVDLRSGMSALRHEAFDLLLSDFLLPDGDATAFIHHVRREEATRNLPIIVVSSSMDEALIDRVLKAGANEALSKPLNLPQLRGLVECMLTTPYVRKNEGSVTGVNCFQWATKDAVIQYCHELDLKLSGPTQEDVSLLMAAALTERAAQGAALGFAYQETVVTHTLRRC